VVDNPLADPQLPRKVMDVVDRVTGGVRRRTTLPIVTVVRGIVFGTMIAVVAVALIVLALITLARGAHELLDIWLDRATAVWVSYLVIALVLFVLGGVLMRKRRSVSPGTP
jgi:cell division protein FtsX